jgi:hypothetical protein
VPNVASGKLPGLKELGVEPSPMEGVMAPLLGHEDRAERLQSLRGTAGRS